MSISQKSIQGKPIFCLYVVQYWFLFFWVNPIQMPKDGFLYKALVTSIDNLLLIMDTLERESNVGCSYVTVSFSAVSIFHVASMSLIRRNISIIS